MSDMTILPFGPILVKTNITSEELTNLRTYVTYTRKPDKKIGCCEQQVAFQEEYNKKIFEIVKPKILEYLKAVGHLKYEIDYNFDIKYDALRLVTQNPGESNDIHDHTSDVTFVIYIDIPDGIYGEQPGMNKQPAGSIEFMFGKDTKGYRIEHFLNPIESHIHTPRNGDMFIFPSSLFHHVNKFKTNAKRVSLAGDIKIINVSNATSF
jgi:hypothetical protein